MQACYVGIPITPDLRIDYGDLKMAREDGISNVQYLTQREVADRFRVTQSTVKNWRQNGLLRYFQAPGSSRILYPLETIESLERESIKIEKEVTRKREIKGNKRELSRRPEKVWRV